MLNLVTVCTENYPMIYAEKLHRRFRTVTKLDIQHFCLTDRPSEVSDWATPLDLPTKSTGWWNKVNLFSPDMPEGWLLYMDLDIVILKNFDDEIKYTIRQNRDVSCVSDAIHWMGEKFSSSFMILKSRQQTHIYKHFIETHQALHNRPGGDQVWIGPQLTDVFYIDEVFPTIKLNLKFHLAKTGGTALRLPSSLKAGVKMIDCGGRPKPHELSMVPYIKENWHDVPTS